jgi:superfamily I DNA/RNA helicase
MRNWIDFDDLVGLALRLLNGDSGIVAHYRDRFRWISVDEFQDLDANQYALLRIRHRRRQSAPSAI